tara:strand:- start:89 stop:580 length:492 start_codon:yes stop_codon:yes gene_type:complete
MQSFFDENIIEDLGGQYRINLPLRSVDNIVCNNLIVNGDITSGSNHKENTIKNGNITIANRITTGNLFLTSDETQKYDVSDLGGPTPLLFLSELKPKSYHLLTKDGKKRDKSVEHWGFLAQDIEKILPQMVSEVNGIKRINYIECIPLLLLKIRELEERIDKL